MTNFGEEFEHIKAVIYDAPWNDPGRLETCLSIALEALGEIGATECRCIATHPTSEPPEAARTALRRMEMRVRLGDDQPAGADITYPSPAWEDVLSPGPDGGDWG